MASYFEFEQTAPDGSIKTFVFKLVGRALSDEARRIIASKSNKHVQGTIVTGPAPYNDGWSFHLDPTSISFFEMVIEVCDANMTYVEEHLDEVGGAFLPRNHWCPWSSTLMREITADIDPVSEKRR